jgi:hypothetical protein
MKHPIHAHAIFGLPFFYDKLTSNTSNTRIRSIRYTIFGLRLFYDKLQAAPRAQPTGDALHTGPAMFGPPRVRTTGDALYGLYSI